MSSHPLDAAAYVTNDGVDASAGTICDMSQRRDVLPGDGRDKSANERADRNWTEILQELRVTQTGIQLISGFPLAVAFQSRFTELDSFQLALYLTLVGLAAAATLLGLAPVVMHRRTAHSPRGHRLAASHDRRDHRPYPPARVVRASAGAGRSEPRERGPRFRRPGVSSGRHTSCTVAPLSRGGLARSPRSGPPARVG